MTRRRHPLDRHDDEMPTHDVVIQRRDFATGERRMSSARVSSESIGRCLRQWMCMWPDAQITVRPTHLGPPKPIPAPWELTPRQWEAWCTEQERARARGKRSKR